MKKCFTLLFALFIAAMATQQLSAAETEFTSLGMGWMTDDMITDLMDWKPVTYQVEILQATDDPTHYRVMAPYGKTFAEAMEMVNNKVLTPEQYDSEGVKFIDIDASNPDDVIFHKTMTGFNLGSGEIFIGVNSRLNVTFKEGIFTAPILGIAIGMEGVDGAQAVNRHGKFRIVLPGIELHDYEMELTPVSQCLTDRTFQANLVVGAGIDRVVYTVVPEMQEDEILTYVEEVAEGGAEFLPRGVFNYEMDEVNKETLIMVGLNSSNEQVGYVWCTYYYVDQSNDGWKDCGTAEFTDGFLQDLIANIPSQTTKCMLQESIDEPGRYRLVDPYAGLKEYPALNKKHADHHHYIYINATTPECIYIEESPIGMESSEYGLMRVNSFVNYFLCAGYDIEECIELELGGIIEDGVLTFPEEALIFSMLNFDGGDWWIADSEGVTAIKLPEGFNMTSGIENVAVETADGQAEYFDLQGVKVSRPQPGKLYIVRQGSKTSKIIM